jgi:hypothetical protein
LLSEELEHRTRESSEAGARIADALPDEQPHEPFKALHCQASHGTDVVRRASPFDEPASDDEVGASSHAVEQALHRPRIMLTIGVELHPRVVSVSDCIAKAGTKRASDSEIEREFDDRNTARASNCRSSVGRAVRDDEHVDIGKLLGHLREHTWQARVLVVRRDHQ